MNELLSCPFCGGEAQMGINKESTVREYFVGCMNCHIRLYKIGYKRFYTEAEAIAAWNSRAERTCECVAEYAKSPIDGKTIVLHRCSACHELMRPHMAYCPNCGARTAGERKERIEQ